MKPNTIIKLVISALALIIIIILFWGIAANHRIDKLQADYNSSRGKNIVYEQQAQILKDSIAKINTTYVILQKNTDSLTRVYNKKVSDRDAIIAKYKKDQQVISSLSGLESIKYFNARVKSTAPVIISSVIPDTAFTIPVRDVMKANHIFVLEDRVIEENINLRQSESSLLRINDNLKLEVNNRQSAVDKLTQLVQTRDNQISEYQKQVDDLNKINKKQHRKDNLQKIGIGAAGAIGIIVALTL